MIKDKFVYLSTPDAFATGQVVDVADGFALISLDANPVGTSPLRLVSLQRLSNEDSGFVWRFFDTRDQMNIFVGYCEDPRSAKPIHLVPKDGVA